MKTLMFLALPASLALSGCMQMTPYLDAHFGETVQMAVAGQTLNPEAGATNGDKPVTGIDGQAARSALDGYQKSFRTPPPTYNILNIGGAVGGGQ